MNFLKGILGIDLTASQASYMAQTKPTTVNFVCTNCNNYSPQVPINQLTGKAYWICKVCNYGYEYDTISNTIKLLSRTPPIPVPETPKPVKLRYKQFVEAKSNDVVIEIRLGADEFAILKLNPDQLAKIQKLEKEDNVRSQIKALLIALEMIENFDGLELYSSQHGMMGGPANSLYFSTSPSYYNTYAQTSINQKYQSQPVGNTGIRCPNCNSRTITVSMFPPYKYSCNDCSHLWP